ncbi:MAG: SulP family sulfate permease [Bermanella sp.]|jgi:SulP family sulfate permease
MPNWLFPWRHGHWQLSSDVIAGLVVAILIIPQAIGYGLLANLPPSVALASCIFPLMAYTLFGRSHALAIGPVAIISLMVAQSLQGIGQSELLGAAQLLALQVALILAAMRIVNLGHLVNFIGHPVIQGFTTAAAVLIISKQIPLVLGDDVFTQGALDLETGLLATTCLLVLLVFRTIPQKFISKLGPLCAVIIGGVAVYYLPKSFATIELGSQSSPHQGIIHLSFDLPWHLFETLLPSAFLIALIGFLESTSVAKTLAKTRKESIHVNQELVGISSANLAASLFGGYPVAGGFGRSMVNHQAGSSSPLAGLFTALFVMVFLIFALDLIAYIPLAALGAIVILAVWSLIDINPLIRNWHVHPKENSIWVVTFICVLWQGVEIGIVAGVALSVIFLIRSAAKPHIAIIGRIPGSAHFRNIKRHKVLTDDNLLAIRIDEGLHFANIETINAFIEKAVMQFPKAQNLLIVCSAVNIVDSDGLDLLQNWNEKLQAQGKQLHLAEVKGPIMDDLIKRGFIDALSPGMVFLSTNQAFDALSQPSDETYII